MWSDIPKVYFIPPILLIIVLLYKISDVALVAEYPIVKTVSSINTSDSISSPNNTLMMPSQLDMDLSLSTTCECVKFDLYKTYQVIERKFQVQSFCSEEATLFGTHQRVISYTLFQSNLTEELKGVWKKWTPDHWEGALIDNLGRMRKLFPGWVLRVYSDMDENDMICNLRCNNMDFFWCDIRNIPIHGDLSSQMVARSWRFLPLGDPTVDIFLVRDLDSSLIARDAAAVQDWLENTTKPFHAFRDHPFHVDRVLGGLWGGRNVLLPNETRLHYHKMVWNQSALPNREFKTADQILLTSIILPTDDANNDVVSYDAYYCDMWRKVTLTKPFPTKRNGTEFLGDVVLWGDSGFGKQLTKCPMGCRPDYGKSWDYC